MVDSTLSLPELLAPAGGPDALRAAVQAGADAVYLGLGAMNARRGAENFDAEGLRDATRYAHLLGTKVYLTANVLVLEHEMADALALVAEAWEAGVDAVIVQDLGLMRCIRRELPDVRIHASTQLNAHDSETVAALAEMGAERVTLAREVSLAQMERIVSTSTVEIESFVHGALCLCYSGQCLLSSMIGGRSGNRGRCAQPCRMPYQLIDERGRETKAPGRYLLSPKDLAGIEQLPALVGAGVAALKIEGRMKSPEYVALVTGVYRAALDRYAADPEGFSVRRSELDVLDEAFSRGFTQAYLEGRSGSEMMSYARPNNRGVPVGRVVSYADRRASVSLDRPLDAADQVEFWTRAGRFAQTVGQMDVGGKAAMNAPARATASFVTERPVSPGDRVFRVASATLLDAARRLLTPTGAKRRVPVEFDVTVRVGEPLAVTARADGSSGSAEGDVVEAARTKAITAEEVMEHVGRLGETVYAPGSWSLAMDGGAGLGYSALHRVRAAALERLDEARLAPWAGRSLPRVTPERPTAARRSDRVVPELVVVVSDVDLARACLREGADRALLAVTAAEPLIELPRGVEPLLPRIARDAEHERLAGWAAEHGRATAGTIGLLRVLRERGAEAVADWPLNVVNPWSSAAIADAGASFVWASPELSGRQLTSLVASSPVPVGTTVFGRLELMVTEHCILQSVGECDARCGSCDRRARRWRLRDQKGYEFPVETDRMGRSHLYNSVTLDLSRSLDEIVRSGVAAIRLEFRTERTGEALELLRSFKRLLRDVASGRPAPDQPLVSPSTTGHFFRGVG